MQVVKKALIALFVIWFAFVLFMPKRNLYYKLEQELALQGIKINENKIEEGLFTFEIDDAVIYIKGIALIHVKKASFFSLLFYNNLHVREINIDKSLASMLPTSLDELTLSYAIWSPRYVMVSAHGAFGAFDGKIDLLEHKVHLDFSKIVSSGKWKHQLKKGKKGLFYEKSF